MRIFMGRTWRLPASRIQGLTRIAMPGSSMTAGYGVSLDQTMPVQLERRLNTCPGDTLYQTINCGINNSTAWNSLSDLKQRPIFFDVLVQELSVTNANIFRRTFNKTYPTMTAARWRAGTPTHDLLRLHLRQAAEYYASLNIPFALVYYIHRDNRVAREIGRNIQELCDENDLPLIHTLDEFNVPITEQVLLDVSTADLHPSERSHGVAAAKIASELAKLKALDQFRPPSSIADAPGRIAAIMQEMHAQGDEPEVILSWAQRALDAKREAAAAEPDPGVRAEFKQAAAELAGRLQQCRRLWRLCGRMAGYVDVLGTPEGRVDHLMRQASEELLRADEVAITVASAHEDWASGLLTELTAGREAMPGGTNAPQDLPDQARQVQEELADRAHDIQSALQDPAMAMIRPVLQDGAAQCDTLAALIEDWRTQALAVERSRAALEAKTSSREGLPFRVASEGLNIAAANVATGLAEFSQFVFATDGADDLLTHFIVVWKTEKRTNPHRFDVVIDVKSFVPRRTLVRHYATIWEDGEQHQIKFRVPMLFVGQVMLSAFGRSADLPDRLAGLDRIEVFSDREYGTSVSLQQAYREPWGTAVFPVFRVR